MFRRLDSFHYGVPWGWVICRLIDGKFELVLVDAAVIVLFTVLMLRLDAARQ